jgi:hypothetical protein
MTSAAILIRRTWPAATLALLVGLLYWPGRGGGFVFDDFPNLVDNAALRVTSLNWTQWSAALLSSDAGLLMRPLAMATFALNHWFTGLDPVPMKLTNIAIHAANAVLVLTLARLLLRLASPADVSPRLEWASRFLAAAWALHPLQLMAVLFVVQRMESLAHGFVFAGLWAYLRGREQMLAGQGGWPLLLAGLLGGTALGALSKESALLLPLYAFLAETCLPRLRDNGDRRIRALFALALFLPATLAAAWLWLRFGNAAAYATREFTLVERLLTEGRVVMDYLRWSMLPSLQDFALYHDDYVVSRGWWSPPSTAFAMAGLALLALSAAWLRNRRPVAALGIAWFLAAHAMTATFIPLELVFEHRNYFALLGVMLVLADVLLLAPAASGPARRIGALLAVLFVAWIAGTTALRAREWSDPLRFTGSEATKHPASPRATYAHGLLLTQMTGFRADSPLLPEARAALERARAVNGSGILPQSALLILAARTGGPGEDAWWIEMEQRLKRRPVGAEDIGAIWALTRCARDGSCLFSRDRMLATFRAALRHGPHPEVLNAYGDYAINVLRDARMASRIWQQAVELRPAEPQYRANLAKLLIATRDFEGARRQIDVLRRSGRFGQNHLLAQDLTQRLDQADGRARPTAREDRH